MLSGRPSTPPLALISSVAIWAASFISAPSAYPPGGDRGPTQPVLIGSAADSATRMVWAGMITSPAISSTTIPARIHRPLKRIPNHPLLELDLIHPDACAR